MTRFGVLLPRRAREAIGRLMGADKLMFEVDHGARRAYEERAAASEPGALSERRAPRRAPSATPPELLGRTLRRDLGARFRAIYDRGFKATEEAGLRRMRAELLAGARGRVLELGAGPASTSSSIPTRVERAGPGRAGPAT